MSKVALRLMLSMALSTPLTQAWAGYENGNAGDTYAAEFILTARDLVQKLRLLPNSELNGLNLNALLGVIMTTKVFSSETVKLRGFEVDAANFPDRKLIHLNRRRWKALRPAEETKARLTLVLHEYLWVLGVDDSQNRESQRLIAMMGVTNFNPNIWWTPLNPANHLSTQVTEAPENCQVENLKFETSEMVETQVTQNSKSCGKYHRKVLVRKASAVAPGSSGWKGTFHTFLVQVYGSQDKLLGEFEFEPTWGQCLAADEGSCRLSGKIKTGGVEFLFWFLR